jgi:hypothetical protein
MLTFYCDCATIVTPVPIWLVTFRIGEKSFVSSFLASLSATNVAAPGKTAVTGNVHSHLIDFPDSEFQMSTGVFAVMVSAFPQTARQLPVHTIVDSSLLLVVKNPMVPTDDTLVDFVQSDWEKDGCYLEMDGVKFESVSVFTVERFQHPITRAPVDFPVRTFRELIV